MEILHSTPVVREIILEPLARGGELVAGNWWRPAEPVRQNLWRRHWLFIIFLLAPVTLAAIYFTFIASDQFVSEAQFIVRSSAGNDIGNLASLMQNQKLSRAVDETYAVSEYVVSRDALEVLVRDHDFRTMLARPQADIFNRFPNFYSRDNKEQLFRRFSRMVVADIDSDSGISTLEVRAFSPEDARDLAAALLQSGEALVNKLNGRAHDDVLKYTGEALEEAKARVVDVEMRLTQFRNAQNVIDPNKEAAAALVALANMTTELVQTEASLSQQIATAPQSPLISSIRARISSYEKEIEKQRARIVGGGEDMASKLAEYDRLILDRQIAAKTLEAAVAQFEIARQDSRRQQLYLETIVEPHIADQAMYPKRILSILAVLGFSLCVYWTIKSLLRTIMEHQA